MRKVIFLIVLSFLLADTVHAAPINSITAAQKLTLKLRRLKATGLVLKDGLKAGVLASALMWDYIPGTSVSVPYVTIQLRQVPLDGSITVLAARSGKLKADSRNGFVMRFPLLKKESSVIFTMINDQGQLEEWEVLVSLALTESAIYVDETCRDYHLKIKEMMRPAGPNLVYLGCRMGSRPYDLALEMIWTDISRIEYLSNIIDAESAILTVPLETKEHSLSRLAGIHRNGQRSLYSLSYEPYVPPPYEAWAGMAFFKTFFEQSNYNYQFNQIATAFLGQFWYRPEDVPLSIMIRGFGSLLSFSNTMTPLKGAPELANQESVQTYFADAEVRYRVFDRYRFRITPLFGGWFFFMNVKSSKFGMQQIIDPVIGLQVQREVGTRASVGLTLRVVPLQSFFNPFQFKTDQSYLEAELTYLHPFQKRNRFFVTSYYGTMKYVSAGLPTSNGSYLVLGGGYGW